MKLGYGEKNTTYASSSAFLDEYFNTSLLPLTVNIEQSITRDLIDEADRGKLFAKHNADIILRGSLKERAEVNKILIDSGQASPNETRIADDQDPQEGLDYFHVNANCIMRDGELITVGVRGVENQPEPESGAPAKVPQAPAPQAPVGPDNAPPAPAPPAKAPTKANARLEMLTTAAAERVQRKFEKAGTIEPAFLADVMSISLEKATEFCAKGFTKETLKAALVALATGE